MADEKTDITKTNVFITPSATVISINIYAINTAAIIEIAHIKSSFFIVLFLSGMDFGYCPVFLPAAADRGKSSDTEKKRHTAR